MSEINKQRQEKLEVIVKKLSIVELRELKRLIHEQLNLRGHLF